MISLESLFSRQPAPLLGIDISSSSVKLVELGRDKAGAVLQSSGTGRLNPGIWAWAVYDWAISPFSTLIVTFVFAAYFQQAVVGDDVRGQSLWALAMSLAGVAFALTAPFGGAAADRADRVKPWIGAATLVCALATAALWFVEPAPRFIALALGLPGPEGWFKLHHVDPRPLMKSLTLIG